MGCKSSTLEFHTKTRPSNVAAGTVFGSGVHVGRAGNVDLSGRNLDFLGAKMVHMINEDELHRTATSLTLTDNRLYTLGKELSLLPNLEEIDMDTNKFVRLPESLTRLPRLWRVNASGNPIHADNGLHIVHRLAALRSLALRDCALPHVPPGLLSCELLECLDLSGNTNLSLTGANFSLLAHLRELRVANCGLKGALPSGIKCITGLTSLDISENALVFEDPRFFGPNFPQTLLELHLCTMQLTSVPQVVASLKKLNYLNLANNPVETLDVLAGRLVKRLPRPGSSSLLPSPTVSAVGAPSNPAAGEADDGASVVSGSHLSTNSRLSAGKLSKAGMIAHIGQPIPLRRLSLRACNLRTVPKYFHKMESLEELDLSENTELDDPHMTLFSLPNLKKLNIVGCPFANNPSFSRNEWFDIAKLSELKNLQWELWKGQHNTSPYRTRIPVEICGLQLESINELALRPNLFCGDTVETVISVLRDGYFKVDLTMDDQTVFSYMHALHTFSVGETFFFPKAGPPPSKASASTLEALGRARLRIAISRYIFSLAMQAANYDAVIIPPLDVMILHYSQMTIDPVKYRADCEAIGGRILNCNYRMFFSQRRLQVAAAKEALVLSKKVWNLMVRSAQKELPWLRYDFWETRAGETAAPATGDDAADGEADYMQTLSGESAATTAAGTVAARVAELEAIDSVQDLCGVLDAGITSHFMEQGNPVYAKALGTFYRIRNCFVENESLLLSTKLDWSRYSKYLALYALRRRLAEAEPTATGAAPTAAAAEELTKLTPVDPRRRPSSILGPHYDSMLDMTSAVSISYLPQPSTRFSASKWSPDGAKEKEAIRPRRAQSALSLRPSALTGRGSHPKERNSRLAMVRNLKTDPVPTVGITLLLHAHRTFHVRYYQTLFLFGLEHVDVYWEESGRSTNSRNLIEVTQKAWEALFDEAYLGSSRFFCFRCEEFLAPERLDHPGSPLDPQGARSEYDATAQPSAPASFRGEGSRLKHVSFCGGDVEHGIF